MVVGQFIHQGQTGLALQNGVDIHFGQFDIAVGNVSARDDFQPKDECFGFGALMGFDITNHHIHPLIFALVGGFQHGIGFAHSGGIAQEDF